jgi:hypothetical protein
VLPLLFAQTLGEYAATSSRSLSESLREFWLHLVDGLKDVDQATWMIIGGVLLALLYLTRRSGRR